MRGRKRERFLSIPYEHVPQSLVHMNLMIIHGNERRSKVELVMHLVLFLPHTNTQLFAFGFIACLLTF